MNFLDLNKPVNDLKPDIGRLLIAEPFLGDPNFSRSVILVCEHGEEGTIGFTLNKATELTLGDLLPELHTPQLKIYQGGPVQMDTLHMIHRIPNLLGGNEIASGIFWGGSYAALEDLILSNKYQPSDLRLFVGYSGWSPGQLEKEMDEGSWIISNTSQDLLFETESNDLWKQAIKKLGQNFAYMANMPVNPQLN